MTREPGSSRRVFYLTTPIYYVNAAPHLGHAYSTIVADAMCRYRRLLGDEVFFLTGTDEHGDKIAQAAANAGETPQALADRNSAAFRAQWDALGIRYDDFIRTTEPRHEAVVRDILMRLWAKGDEIYFSKYGGQYCFGCERFYTEKEIVDGKCPDHQTPLTYIEEENYFFRMSKYQDWLRRELTEHPDRVRPERYRNELLAFLREPLEDLCISRPRARLEWGIPLPFDDRFVTYVWFDALINYVSALGPLDGERFRHFWPHAQHLIGKDILKPHGIYWPCMLEAAGLPVYQRLNVHGYWSLGGGKMSKSVGNVVEALALADKYGHDVFRYFLMREMPFGLDANFSEDALVARLNADLANDLGNLVARATTLIAGGDGAGESPGPPAPEDEAVARAFEAARTALEQAMDEFAFHRALTEIWAFVGVVNRYIDATQPWTLGKDPARRRRLLRVLLTLADALRCLGVVLEPFVPAAAAKLRAAVGDPNPPRLDRAWMGSLTRVPPTERLSGLFPRIEQARPGTPRPERRAAAGGSRAGRVSLDEFRRLDLRVAEVLAAERVPKSEKLLKLTVRLDDGERTVVAGIAEHYAPEALRGRKVVVVANLEPVSLMGVTSAGMILAGSAGDALALLTLDRDLPPGARVR
jgi:methionyl-tRNA synthetase